ncbi:RNA polymerase sigma factor [Candidatus Uhrbacteria bacterium]|nr:RNA polymerase sigma factor [Candidatus Uhrbacteria bacterium]
MTNHDVSRADEDIVGDALVQKEAFALLVHRYQERLTRYLRRLGVFKREDMEDILQNVFLKTYRNLNEFDRKLKFSSWIYRITHNEAMSFFRSTSSRPEGHPVDDAELVLEQLSGSADTSMEAELGLNASQLTEAMKKLEAKYRDVIVLRYFEEREYAEISDILRIPTGTVATLLSRAKKRLRETLSHLA